MPWKSIDQKNIVGALVRVPVKVIHTCTGGEWDETCAQEKEYAIEFRDYQSDPPAVLAFDLLENKAIGSFVWYEDDHSEDWNEPFYCDTCNGRLGACKQQHPDYRIAALSAHWFELLCKEDSK